MIELLRVEGGEVVSDDARVGAGGVPAAFAPRGGEADADRALVQRIRLTDRPWAASRAEANSSMTRACRTSRSRHTRTLSVVAPMVRPSLVMVLPRRSSPPT